MPGGSGFAPSLLQSFSMASEVVMLWYSSAGLACTSAGSRAKSDLATNPAKQALGGEIFSKHVVARRATASDAFINFLVS